MADKHKDRAAIWDAMPIGRENAEPARTIADRAGVNRRSCGTKLNAMSLTTAYHSLGLRGDSDEAQRQMVWWKEPRDAF